MVAQADWCISVLTLRSGPPVIAAAAPRSSSRSVLAPSNVGAGSASPGPSSPFPRSPGRSPARPQVSVPKDFSYLLRPEIYHPLTPLTVPAPFHGSPQQANLDTPIPELLATGHFRAAAIAAVQQLTGAGGAAPPDPADHARIFDLVYTRLACLTLIDATPLAAQEVKALEDLNSAFYLDDITGAHLVPWELRVLNVRLQAMGFGDPRRAVMSYYDLAREARSQIAAAAARHDNSARELWKDRLCELGIKVAGALVEMDDPAGAAAHLGTLRDRGDGKLAMAKALLWLHIGDVEAARSCVQSGEIKQKTVGALCDMADGKYGAALATWRELKEEVDDEMVGVNLAVCLLYMGTLEEGRAVLESLVASGYSSHTLLFNLTTVYELCTERSRQLKLELAQRVADMEPTARGWEKRNADFKL